MSEDARVQMTKELAVELIRCASCPLDKVGETAASLANRILGESIPTDAAKTPSRDVTR